eukprot:gene3004-3285_t
MSKDESFAVVKKVPGCSPEQVSLTYFGVGKNDLASVLVSWVTCEAIIETPPGKGDCTAPGSVPGTVTKALSTKDLTSVVLWGQLSKNGALAFKKLAKGKPTAYTHDYSSKGGLKYASPVLHHVLITGLTPGQQYQYTIVDNVLTAAQTSSKMRTLFGLQTGPNPITNQFKVPGKPAGQASSSTRSPFPFNLGIIGDPSQTYATVGVLQNLASFDSDLNIIVGDLS